MGTWTGPARHGMRLKSLLANLMIPLAAGLAAPAAEAQVGLSIQLGDPRYYGRLDLRDRWGWGSGLPGSALLRPRPVVVNRGWRGRAPAPVYLRVPPGHAKNWGKHCRRYGACGVPVYFVRDDWYRDEYIPRWRGSVDRRRRRRDDQRDWRRDRWEDWRDRWD